MFAKRANSNFVFLFFIVILLYLLPIMEQQLLMKSWKVWQKEPGFKIDIQNLSHESFCNVIIEENKIYILEMCYNIQYGELTMALGNVIAIGRSFNPTNLN